MFLSCSGLGPLGIQGNPTVVCRTSSLFIFSREGVYDQTLRVGEVGEDKRAQAVGQPGGEDPAPALLLSSQFLAKWASECLFLAVAISTFLTFPLT